MGLSITVGILAELLEDDPEAAEEIQGHLATINELLRSSGLPEHNEPTVLPLLESRSDVEGFPYSCIHHLRRFYAHCVACPGTIPGPFGADEPPHEDAVLTRISGPGHHLLWHSDCEGYYVPVSFPEVLESEAVLGAGVGSSQRLLAELTDVAAPLGVSLVDGVLTDEEASRVNGAVDSGGPHATALMVWLSLFEAARLSVEHGTAIHFG